jgi:hypothetical protein
MAYSERLANRVRGLPPVVAHAETQPPKQPKRKAVRR